MPGGPTAQVAVGGGGGTDLLLPESGFGEATDYVEGPTGRFQLKLQADGEALARTSERLEDGARYTVVASPEGDDPVLRVYEDGEPVAGRTRWRTVHAAPELDEAEFVLDDRGLGRLAAGEASDYRTVEPGTHRIGARRPGEDGDLVESPAVSLVAGTAQTAYLIGTGGEPARFVVLEDSASAPEEGPATGLGGLASDGGSPWIAALLAAALAGAAGGLGYALFARRRRQRG